MTTLGSVTTTSPIPQGADARPAALLQAAPRRSEPWWGVRGGLGVGLIVCAVGWVAAGRAGLDGPIPLVLWCAWAAWLVALAWHDAHTSRLPRVATLPALACAVLLWWGNHASIDSAAMAMAVLVTAGLWAGVAWWTRRRHGQWVMGLGDAVYVAPTALCFAAYDLLYVAGWCAVAAGLWVLSGVGRTRGQLSVPCGPVLAGAALLMAPWVWVMPVEEVAAHPSASVHGASVQGASVQKAPVQRAAAPRAAERRVSAQRALPTPLVPRGALPHLRGAHGGLGGPSIDSG